MSGLYALFLLASILALFSIPLLMFALLMRLVGRIGPRTLVAILAVFAIFWVPAIFFWVVVEPHVNPPSRFAQPRQEK